MKRKWITPRKRELDKPSDFGILADAAARMGTHRRRQASHGVHDSVQAVQKPEHLQMGGGELGVSGQPGGQVGWALEVEQGIGQGFQLLQRQRLDLGCGGTSTWAAAAGELAEGHLGGFSGLASGFTSGLTSFSFASARFCALSRSNR